MTWNELYPKDRQPTQEEIAAYLGGARGLWEDLFAFFETRYKAKPKLTHSGCSGMPGWNVKFQKSGTSFGTLYPHENNFDVMVVVAYRLDNEMQLLLPMLSEKTAAKYRAAQDFMKMGKYMMLTIDSPEPLEDFKKIAMVKLPPK